MDRAKSGYSSSNYLEFDFGTKTPFLSLQSTESFSDVENQFLGFLGTSGERIDDQPVMETIRDVNDSIVQKALIEHERHDGYSIHSEFKGVFDSERYRIDAENTINYLEKFILKIPSRVFVSHENTFSISMKAAKSKRISSDNILVRLYSNNFHFSRSMVQLMDVDTEITLTRRASFVDFTIFLKIFIDNQVVFDRRIDLLERK